MDQLRNFGDSRQTASCAYCGGGANSTDDHVPSKVLLDEPFPPNLPVVSACPACNQGFSLDEEYLACLLDCVLAGSASSEAVGRSKVRRILSEKPALAARLAAAIQSRDRGVLFAVEHDRVQKVLLKLARGHALFELNEPQFEEPSYFHYAPLPFVDAEIREKFERQSQGPELAGWPEVGSRAMQRIVLGKEAGWIVVQAGRYRYLASADNGGILVRMVLSEYLGCEVIWND
jgi:hypothetical protein